MDQRYYRQNARGLSLRECLRWSPGLGGLLNWLRIRTGLRKSPSGALFLPAYFRDIRATRDELSPRCLSFVLPRLAEFEALGFSVASFVKMPHNLTPSILDGGGCWLLHESRQFMGHILYTKVQSSRPSGLPVENLSLYISCELESGRVLAATNTRNRFDSMAGTEVLFNASANPAALLHDVDQWLQQSAAMVSPTPVCDVDAMAAFIDARSEQRLIEQVRRGFLVPLSDAEVDAARAAYVRSDSGRQPNL